MDPTILIALAVLACPIGMGLMMWFMMRKQHGSMGAPQGALSPGERLARLEAEQRALEQQIAAQNAVSPEEKLARLEAERLTLEQQIAAGRNNGAVGKRSAPMSPHK